MSKYLKLSLIIITSILIVAILIVKFIPFGSKYYKNSKLEIPKLSFDIKIEEDKSIIFKTFRSKKIIKMELTGIFNEHQKYLCNNKYYYYDNKNDITIIDFNISNSSIFNKVEIKYRKGKLTNVECGKVGDYTKLRYSVIPVNETGYCYVLDEFEYKDDKGNNYSIHYNCFGNLAFTNGMGKMIYIHSIISYRWLSMEDLTAFLELQVKNQKMSKIKYDDDGSILYINDDFSLLKCDTEGKNKDIYIAKTISNNENLCKK